MKLFLGLSLLALQALTCSAQALQSGSVVPELESGYATAQTRLADAAKAHPGDTSALTAYAEFLDRHADPRAIDEYSRLLDTLRQAGESARADAISRRVTRLKLLRGDQSVAGESDRTAASTPRPVIMIPGPLSSFARMAALAPGAPQEEVLASLARNVVMNGYHAGTDKDALEQTEYLKLIDRYVSQARDLEKLAGKDKVIRVTECDSAEAGELLKILGYRQRGSCGSELVLETVNATRAFITSDSAFPLQQLEQALRSGHAFELAYAPTPIPVLFGTDYWLQGQKQPVDFLDFFLGNPSVCRLYSGLSKLDAATADALREGIPFSRLKAFAPILDFYGSEFEIRGGEAVLPGGPATAAGWAALAGVPPAQGVAFFDKLLSKDDGWLASMYDAVFRLQTPVAAYFADPARLKRFYSVIRGRATSPGPARPVFRSNTEMLLLLSRIRTDNRGVAHIPGGVGVWKTLFSKRKQTKVEARPAKSPGSWSDPDDVLEGVFTLTRNYSGADLLKIFLIANELDRIRKTPLTPAAVERLARDYPRFASQYSIFGETPALTEAAMFRYLDAADDVSKIKDLSLRADAAGSLQALTGLWQILVRQGSLGDDDASPALVALTTRFSGIKGNAELFDAARQSLSAILEKCERTTSSSPGDRILDLLAGPGRFAESGAWDQQRLELSRILDAQRIIPVDSLFQFADLTEAQARGNADSALINKLAGRISEVELPLSTDLNASDRPSDSSATQRRIDSQRKLNLRAALAKAGSDPNKLREIKALLAPLLRDSLVALDYAYYAPPGDQLLASSPLFVRSHDFLGSNGSGMWRTTEAATAGWPANGGAHLEGSLAALPYALAVADQNFLIPKREQSLIWADLAPQLLVAAKSRRWWNVTASQTHWVALHMAYGRELVAEAALDPAARVQLIDALRPLATPGRAHWIEQKIAQGSVKDAAAALTPAELFWVARTLAPVRRDDSCVLSELRSLAAAQPGELNYDAISRAFGTPKPTLTNSYRSELLNMRMFPTLMGYSSRIMAETWESNGLYWAALSDELHLPPAALNLKITEWTQKVLESTFANNLEDWEAVLRSLQSVGESEKSEELASEEHRAGLN